MNFTKTMFALAIGSVGIMGSMSAHAVFGLLNTGDVLSITAGAQSTDIDGVPTAFATGSWFALDRAFPLGVLTQDEQILLAQGTNGIVIGSFTAPGDFHLGTTHPLGDTATGPVVASWSFNSSTGTNYFNSAIPGAAAPGVGIAGGGVSNSFNMSAWDMAWISDSSNLSAYSWNVTNSGEVGMSDSNGAAAGSGVYGNGLGRFSWSGIYGDTYTLDYTATIQAGAASGYKYALHLTGVVTAVPEASTYGMMLTGLSLVGALVARRRKV